MVTPKPKLSTIGLANPIVLKSSIILFEVNYYKYFVINIALNPGILVIWVIHLFHRILATFLTGL